MATTQPIHDSSEYERNGDRDCKVENAHLEPVESSFVLACGPQHPESRKSGLTDLDLLPSQQRHMQDNIPRVQPTDNPYHWEVPAEGRNRNISSWVKASWTRTNEIVRQRAGTLNRKAAVRRSRNDGKPSNTDGTVHRASRPQRVVMKSTTHRSFSFEDEQQRKDLSTTPDEAEEDDALSDTITRVDSGVVPLSGGRNTRFREELEERPHIARTFSEILGSEAFVPIALLEEE